MDARVLVTNDDGIAAPGLAALASAALAIGAEVVVAAPVQEASGSSAAVTAAERDGRVTVEERTLAGLENATVYAVGATPAYIALLAMRGAFGPAPAFTLSGVNRGANAGNAIIHSGTVGAALTAAAHGCRCVAVSLDVLADSTVDRARHWHTAAALALDLLPWLADALTGTVLNLNVPDVAPERVRGLRRATLAPFGQVQMTVVDAGKGFVRVGLTEPAEPVAVGSDVAWLAENYACVTPLRGVREARDVAMPW